MRRGLEDHVFFRRSRGNTEITAHGRVRHTGRGSQAWVDRTVFLIHGESRFQNLALRFQAADGFFGFGKLAAVEAGAFHLCRRFAGGIRSEMEDGAFQAVREMSEFPPNRPFASAAWI